VQVRLERPLMALPGDAVVLREIAPANTLGGATVIDPSPPRHGAAGEERLRRIVAGEPLDAPHDRPATAPPPPQRTAPGPLAQSALALLEDDGLRARSASGLAESLERSPAELNAALDELIAAGSVIRAGRDLAFSTHAVAQAEAAILELGSEAGEFSLADARDRLGVGRKHTQALLELLDARRVTLRRADKRVLRKTRENP
jgi:hypothetical protein